MLHAISSPKWERCAWDVLKKGGTSRALGFWITPSSPQRMWFKVSKPVILNTLHTSWGQMWEVLRTIDGSWSLHLAILTLLAPKRKLEVLDCQGWRDFISFQDASCHLHPEMGEICMMACPHRLLPLRCWLSGFGSLLLLKGIVIVFQSLKAHLP